MQGRSEKSRGEPHILDRIVVTKRAEVRALQRARDELRARSRDAPPTRDFARALSDPERVALIAEVKRRSPGAGPIRPDLDPASLAEGYERAGASAVSVLTDGDYFGGSLEHLVQVRERISIPILRKDFILDELQLLEARAAGADAVLLIVRILDDAPLRELRLAAEEMGMAALVEAHDREEVERALRSGARLLGINNRDLSTFTTRLTTTLALLPGLPGELVVVSESGIRSREDVGALGEAGVHAVLVGESLLRADDPEEMAAGLVGVSRSERSTEERARWS